MAHHHGKLGSYETSLRPTHTSDWITTIMSLADSHEFLVVEPLATACSNTSLCESEKSVFISLWKGAKWWILVQFQQLLVQTSDSVAASSDWLPNFEHVQSELLVAATPLSVALTGSCVSTTLLAFLQWWNRSDSVAHFDYIITSVIWTDTSAAFFDATWQS